MIMFNITLLHKITLAFLVLVPLASGIRQSQIGNNDWSIQNIGKITELSFAPYNQDEKNMRHFKNIFYLSELGIFGLLDRKNGEIVAREQLGVGEKIIESDEKELVVVTHNGQIIRYNKLNMQRTLDNRMMQKEFKGINSYVRVNNKVYISDDKIIRELGSLLKNVEEISTVPVPSGLTYLKVFASTKGETKDLYALTYESEKTEVCLNEVKSGTLHIKKCYQMPLDPSTSSPTIFPSTGNIYLNSSTKSYYLNFQTLQSQTLSSRPISYTSNGIRFENGLSFTKNGLVKDNIQMVETNRYDVVVYSQIHHADQELRVYQGTDSQMGGRVAVVKLAQREFKVSRVWASYLSPIEIEIYVEYEDLELVLYSLLNANTKQYKQVWSREESLAYIQKVLFMKYQGFQDHLNNPYHMKMDEQHYLQLPLMSKIQQIPGNFIARVKSQFVDLYDSMMSTMDTIISTLNNPSSLQSLLQIQTYIKSTTSTATQKKYGLQKYTIVITSYNTMFSIDTKSSKIIWKYISIIKIEKNNNKIIN